MKLKHMLPQPRQLVINDYHGIPTDVVFHLITADNAEFDLLAKSFAQRMLKGGAADIPLAEADAENVRMLATCLTGWDNLLDEDDQPIPFTNDEAIKLLGNPGAKFIRDQVEGYVMKRTEFFRHNGEQPQVVAGADSPA